MAEGISLGFAFNAVYYGSDETISISRDEWMANARKTVNAVLTQVRKIKGLETVPIVIGLFEQAAKDDIAGGNYVYQAVSQDGGTTIDQYEKVAEAHIILPVAAGSPMLPPMMVWIISSKHFVMLSLVSFLT